MNEEENRFAKIELLLKLPSHKVSDLQSTIKTEFIDSKLRVCSNHIIIVSDTEDKNGNVIASKGQIYNLNEVVAYKTYKK